MGPKTSFCRNAAEGISASTGPKAGGPHALLRYAVERAVSVNITAQGGDPALLNLNP